MKCVWNINFFTGQAIAKLTLVLHFRQEILHTEFSLIWKTPWLDQNDLFLTFVIREIRNLSYEKLTFFFLDKLLQKFFFSCAQPTLGTLHPNFGCIWATPWADEKGLFSKFYNPNLFEKIVNFPKQAMPNVLFVLHPYYTGDTPYRVWFSLNNFLTQWKWTIFKIP